MYKGLRVEQVLQPPRGNIHSIANLGVAPEWRSQGIGTQLLLHFLEQAKEANGSLAALDVAVDNPRVEALFTQLGFVVGQERNSTLSNPYGKVPAHRRMELKL
jgi:ribosomal protein S18 acetylase RimI-like enzyme